jgi:hypothetical protein
VPSVTINVPIINAEFSYKTENNYSFLPLLQIMQQPCYSHEDIVDFQVLQRDLHSNESLVTFSNGEITAYKTGGPYSIEGKTNIYVGDIWVMAGQSNMRGHGYLKDAFRSDTDDEENKEPFSSCHLFDSTETWRVASDPSHCLQLSKRTVHHALPDPTVRNPEICQYRGASLAPAFGSTYSSNTKDQVPVGLIASAHGGVSLQDWKRPSELNTETYNTTLYGAMIDRINQVGNYIAGVLWYQGESDTLVSRDAETYGQRFQEWIKILRLDLKRPNLPIVFVQLGPHKLDVPETIKNWMTVQDQQIQLMGIDNYITGVASRDCILDDRLHLSKDGLSLLGKRLAIAALLAIEGKAKLATPLPKTAIYEKIPLIPGLLQVDSIKLEFDLPPNFEFYADGLNVIGFEIENQQNVVILRACIEQDKQSIRLYLSDNPIPTEEETATISYGMNQQEINLNLNQDSILPVFRNVPVINE